MSTEINRCRLVLGITAQQDMLDKLSGALEAGDVASLIITDTRNSGAEGENFCKRAVEIAHSQEVAVLIAEDTQMAGRANADGLYLESTRNQLAELVARFSPQKIVGCGGVMERHTALQLGELGPDFMLLGKLGKDIKPEAHPKNLKLAEWWADFVEIPAIAPAGQDVESVVEVAQTGIDFVLLQSAVFAEGVDAAKSVERANSLLDKHAPELLEAE